MIVNSRSDIKDFVDGTNRPAFLKSELVGFGVDSYQ